MSVLVKIYRNPLMQVSDTHEYPSGTTLRQITEDQTACHEWPSPTLATVNGDPWLRERWGEPLPDGAEVHFRALLAGRGSGTGYAIGGAMIVAGAAITIASWGSATPAGAGMVAAGIGMMAGGAVSLGATYYASLVKPDVPSSYGGEGGSPTYSVGYRGNRKRVGEPIPVIYGRHKIMPDLVSESYVYNSGNDQYAVAIMCIGNGEFDVDTSTLQFGDAKFSELSGVTYEIVRPGGAVTICPDHVTTSGSVSGQPISGPGPLVDFFGATRLSFSVAYADDASSYVDVTASDPIFSSVTWGDITFYGTTNFNGTFPINALGPNRIQVIVPGNFAGISESPINATAEYNSVLLNNPVGLHFDSTTGQVIYGAVGTFSSLSAGTVLQISNTNFNNITVTVASISGDGSSITVTGTPLNLGGTSDILEQNPRIQISGGGWSSWFEVGSPSDSVSSIEADVAFAAGLGTVNGSGGIDARSVTFEFQYQGLSSGGVPSGSVSTQSSTVTDSRQKTVRSSIKWTNDTGYQRARVRVRRTDAESTNTSALNAAVWSGLKGYLPQTPTYRGVTVLAVVAKASEQLSAQTAGQISVVATRKIPTWNGTTWSEPTATSSIAWALADVLRNAEYGAGLSDAEIDLAALLSLNSTWTTRDDTFNGVFDQSVTIWEALQKIARCGRAQPVLTGGVVTFVRDRPQTVRAALFTPDRIIPGSWRVDYRLPQDGDPDGTSLSWIDPSAGWQVAHKELPAGTFTSTVANVAHPTGGPVWPITVVRLVTALPISGNANVVFFTPGVGITGYDAIISSDGFVVTINYLNLTHLTTSSTATVTGNFTTAVRPQSIDLFGCTDSAQALAEAKYNENCRKYQRKAIMFSTELDGHLVGIGDLIGVAHDVVGYKSAQAVGVSLNGFGETVLELDDNTIEAGEYYALLRKPDGSTSGPHGATLSGTSLNLHEELSWEPRTDLSLGDRTVVSLGVSAPCQDYVVTAVSPNGPSQIDISATIYDARIHSGT